MISERNTKPHLKEVTALNILQFFRNVKQNYIEFLFGIIIGFIVFLLISQILISFLIFLGIANTMISAIILLRISPKAIPKIAAGSNPAEEGCPECGSSRRHKKTCSIGKARREKQ